MCCWNMSKYKSGNGKWGVGVVPIIKMVSDSPNGAVLTQWVASL